jgi:hypothetical protein
MQRRGGGNLPASSAYCTGLAAWVAVIQCTTLKTFLAYLLCTLRIEQAVIHIGSEPSKY